MFRMSLAMDVRRVPFSVRLWVLEGCRLITLTSDGFNISVYSLIACSCVLCSEQLRFVFGNPRL